MAVLDCCEDYAVMFHNILIASAPNWTLGEIRMRMRKYLKAAAALSLLAAFGAAVAGPNDPLVQEGNLEYVGAFRLPSGNFGGSTFTYGGRALAFNPANNSLFIVGSDEHQMVAEINIPNIVNSASLTNLATATVRQNFVDASEGRRQQQDNGNGVVTGGLLVHGGRLIGTVYRFYDSGSSTQSVSHYSRPLSLSTTGQVVGLTKVGNVEAGFVSGYMTHVPESWRSAFGAPALTGNCCISIIGRTSWGPAAFAFDPGNIGQSGTVPAQPMVYYTSSNPLDRYESTGISFNGTTRIPGVVFPEGTSSVLFVGHQGIGPYCYGTGSQCNDPSSPYQGDHAYPYRSQIWAFNANDLLRVKNGQAQPWSVRPYAIWHFDTPFDKNSPGGVAYDPATARIFVAQRNADGDRPVILVYRVGQPSGENPQPQPPNPPEQVRVD
jgi:hypothetical protein